MKVSLSRPFEGIIGLLLLAAVLFLGCLFGISFAVITRAIAGETLLRLWGPALGAAIGASATLGAAIYNQHRSERRELRKPLQETLRKLLSFAVLLDRARANMHKLEEVARAGKGFDAGPDHGGLKHIEELAIDFDVPAALPRALHGAANAAASTMVVNLRDCIDMTEQLYTIDFNDYAAHFSKIIALMDEALESVILAHQLLSAELD